MQDGGFQLTGCIACVRQNASRRIPLPHAARIIRLPAIRLPTFPHLASSDGRKQPCPTGTWPKSSAPPRLPTPRTAGGHRSRCAASLLRRLGRPGADVRRRPGPGRTAIRRGCAHRHPQLLFVLRLPELLDRLHGLPNRPERSRLGRGQVGREPPRRLPRPEPQVKDSRLPCAVSGARIECLACSAACGTARESTHHRSTARRPTPTPLRRSADRGS